MFREVAADGAARAGLLSTPHGDVATPGFMPVGTRATVKTLDSRDLAEVGAEMVLANTYHLMLRPGHDTIAALGELHGFMDWAGPILTDSGGYQVFSLQPEVSEDGLAFRSSYDGSLVHLTPEDAVHVQETLGPDIAMVLDELVGLPSPREVVEAAMLRTTRWAERAWKAHTRTDQALFGIVQGGVDEELRAISARAMADIGFPGFGIGGLAVGEQPAQRNRALTASFRELPASKIRYVMGLGDTDGLLDAIGLGADLFDCVLPTRLARHGKVLSRDGDFSIRRQEWSKDPNPIEEDCACLTCRRYSRGYLRHLRITNEFLGHRLLTIHNLTYTLRLVAEARVAIAEGRFDAFVEDVRRRRVSPNSEPPLQ